MRGPAWSADGREDSREPAWVTAQSSDEVPVIQAKDRLLVFKFLNLKFQYNIFSFLSGVPSL